MHKNISFFRLEPAPSKMTSTERTFVINFRVIPAKVKYQDISDFIQHKLGFEFTQIRHLQITNGRVFVGTDSPQIAEDVVQEHNMKHQLEHEGKAYTIPISMEDGSIEVRVHDIRPSVSNRQLALRMQEYGQIISIREELWKDFFPGVPNGVRVLRMKLRKSIPSYITVENFSTLVTYKGQVATCKHCNRNVHYTLKCSEYAKSLQVSVNDRLTMADVLKGRHHVNNPSTQPSNTSTFQLTKSALLHQSNISLASDISSAEHMDADLQTADFPNISEMTTTNENLGISTPAGESEVVLSATHNTTETQSQSVNMGNNQTVTHQTSVKIKRPRSPQSVEPNIVEKRQSRSKVRSDPADPRLKSRSRNH